MLRRAATAGRRFLIPVALLLTAAGCGWHLRGVHDMPDAMAVTYLNGPNQTSELLRYIRRDLKAAGIEVVRDPAPGAAVLHIRPQSGLRTLSVGPDGKAREYELYYTVQFRVDKPDSAFEVPEQQVTLIRDFIFDPLDSLAVGQERALLEESMERDLARLVIERLAAAGLQGGDARETGGD